MHHYIVCAIPSEVYVVEKYDLKKVETCDISIVGLFKKYSKPYPLDIEVRKL
jgi:hypothetical protein